LKLFIPIFIFSQILFSQCDFLPYNESEYYYYPNLDIDHVGSTLDCYYSTDWDILNELITLNNLSDIEVGILGYQNWNDNGRLKNFTLDYSSSSSHQYINQKINMLPGDFGELEMLESLEMYYHDLIVFPLSFPQLENLRALNMKGNKLKILNPDFGSLSNLEVLDLGYNDLVALPESISELESLNYFWIFGNDINYIPNSVCDLDLDWSGELGDYIYFGSGGNHLCKNVPDCIENSTFFNIMLEEEGYAFQIESIQVCECSDENYPDCAGLCSEDDNYGSIIDACGLCDYPDEACILDCTGDWGGSAIIDECGICDGDGSNCAEFGTLSLSEIGDGIWDVLYESPYDISQIYFEIIGGTATSAEGINFFPTDIGDVVSGAFFVPMTAGVGMLLTISINGNSIELGNIIVTDSNNHQYTFLFDNGNIQMCNEGFDCLGECGGPAILDECGVCDGIAISTWYADNDGDGFGDSQNTANFCYEYEGYASNSDDIDDSEFCPYQDSEGNIDCYGNCIIESDCSGLCGGTAELDECGICDGDNLTCTGCMDDTACNYSLTATISSECEYSEENYDCSGNCNVQVDCDGICGGNLVDDACGICGGGILEVENCVECPEFHPADCAGTCGGSLDNDECGVCNGDNSSCTGCMKEVACNYNLNATISGDCEYPVENYDCDGNCTASLDCNNECGGAAVEDECGVCGGNNSSCAGCDGVANSGLVDDECGVCGGDNSTCTGCTDPSANNFVGAFNFDITILCGDDDDDSLPDCCTYDDLSTELLSLPTNFDIVNNYPNPFNPYTAINYSIPQTAWVSLSIYDLKGELVSTIVDGVVSPGNYNVVWNGNDFTNRQMPTGIYFSILKSNEILVSHKLLLLK
jgi:hypothetical protein